MRTLVESLLNSGIPFLHFDRHGVPISASPEALLLLGSSAEHGVVPLGNVARELATATAELAAPREFEIRLGHRSLHVGAVAMLASNSTVEVLMVLSIAAPPATGNEPLPRDTAPDETASRRSPLPPAAPPSSALQRYFEQRRLTERERQVAEYVAMGMPSATIAGILGISVHTVRRHTERVFAKTGARSRGELAHLAFQHQKDIKQTAISQFIHSSS